MGTSWRILGLVMLALCIGPAQAGECTIEEIIQLRDAGFSAERIAELCAAEAGDATAPTAVPLRIIYFRSDKPTVMAGDTATLEWQTEGATAVEISGIGPVAASGARVVDPAKDGTHYALVARGVQGDPVREELSIAVGYPMVISPDGKPGSGSIASPAAGGSAQPGAPVLTIPIPAILDQFLPPPEQDCVRVDWQRAELRQRGERWLIVVGDLLLKNFGAQRDEARQALRILRHYRVDQQCFVGRPDPSLEYYLAGGRAPRGAMPGEDCVSFDPRALEVQRVGNRWKIVEGSHWIMDFDHQEAEARQALRILRHHGFTQQCFVGRPNPSLTYLRR